MKDISSTKMNIKRKMSVDSDNESTPLVSSATSSTSFGAMQCMFSDSDVPDSEVDKPREISPVTPKSFVRRPFCYPGGHFENTNLDIFKTTNDENLYERYQYFTKMRNQLEPNEPSLLRQISVPAIMEKKITQSSIVTIFSIWNTMMGTSLLTMAWGIQKAGLFPGTIAIILIAAVTLYTTYCVLQVNDNHGVGDNDGVAYLCKLLLGRWAEIIAKIFSMLVLLGANIVYWVLMSNFLYNSVIFLHGFIVGVDESKIPNITVICPREKALIIPNITEITNQTIPIEPPSIFDQVWDLHSTVPVFLGFIMFPLVNFKNITFFTKFNSLGTFSVLFLIIFVFVKGVGWGINITDWSAEFTFRPNFTALTGILAMSYFIHNIIVALMKSNKNPANNGRDLSIAFALVTFTYLFIGVTFYMTFPLAKSCIEDNLLNNFEEFDSLTIIARILLMFQLVTVFPLIGYMLRQEILQTLQTIFSTSPDFSYYKVVFLNLVVITTCILTACFFPRIGTLIRYTGAMSGFIHIFTLPCLLKMASLRKQAKLTLGQILFYTFVIIFGFVNLTSQFFISE